MKRNHLLLCIILILGMITGTSVQAQNAMDRIQLSLGYYPISLPFQDLATVYNPSSNHVKLRLGNSSYNLRKGQAQFAYDLHIGHFTADPVSKQYYYVVEERGDRIDFGVQRFEDLRVIYTGLSAGLHYGLSDRVSITPKLGISRHFIDMTYRSEESAGNIYGEEQAGGVFIGLTPGFHISIHGKSRTSFFFEYGYTRTFRMTDASTNGNPLSDDERKWETLQFGVGLNFKLTR